MPQNKWYICCMSCWTILSVPMLLSVRKLTLLHEVSALISCISQEPNLWGSCYISVSVSKPVLLPPGGTLSLYILKLGPSLGIRLHLSSICFGGCRLSAHPAFLQCGVPGGHDDTTALHHKMQNARAVKHTTFMKSCSFLFRSSWCQRLPWNIIARNTVLLIDVLQLNTFIRHTQKDAVSLLYMRGLI